MDAPRTRTRAPITRSGTMPSLADMNRPYPLLPSLCRRHMTHPSNSPRRPIVILDDREVTIESFTDVVICGRAVALSRNPSWRKRVGTGREVLESALRAGRIVYGVSTGVGNNSSAAVGRAAQVEFALSVMEQHGCGVGEPLSREEGRAVVLARLISLSKGLSAVRLGLLEAMCALVNHDVVPVIPRWGSVGASGDLTPLSYVAAALAGRRHVYFRGKRTGAARALTAAGLKPFALGAKEPLAIMNGTSAMKCSPIITIRATQKKMMSKPVTRTLVG